VLASEFQSARKRVFQIVYDLACGGSQQAKAAAVSWRDGKLAELETFTMAEFHNLKRSDNVSGRRGFIFT